MRISVVSSSVAPERLGGSEAYAADLAVALAERHEVVLHSGATGGPPGVELECLPGLPDLARDAGAVSKAAWHLRDQWRATVHPIYHDDCALQPRTAAALPSPHAYRGTDRLTRSA